MRKCLRLATERAWRFDLKLLIVVHQLLRCAHSRQFDGLWVCGCVVLDGEMAEPDARHRGTERYLKGATRPYAELLGAVVGLCVVPCNRLSRNRERSAPGIAQPDCVRFAANDVNGTHVLVCCIAKDSCASG
jgi:hypothetical protein